MLLAVGTALLGTSCHSCDGEAPPPLLSETAPVTTSGGIEYRPGYISLLIDGTVGGKDVRGLVQSETVTCAVELQGTIGNLYHITWSGHLDRGNTLINGTPFVAGEMIGPPGTSTFGTNPVNPPPNKIANANVDVAGTRVGGGLAGGTGTLTMVSATIGNIHASLDTGGHLDVTGEWDCTAAVK